jgi:tetratricopeptide (TPR) repeat protein
MLAPRDKRWPYLMGHLYNDSARQEKAIEAFEAALAIDPEDPATIFSLAEVSLQHGEYRESGNTLPRARAGEGGARRRARGTGQGRACEARLREGRRTTSKVRSASGRRRRELRAPLGRGSIAGSATAKKPTRS